MLRRIRAVSLGLTCLLISGCLDDNFSCQEDGRVLTNIELLESAFTYEVNEKGLADLYQTLGLNGLKEANPDCCLVMRMNDEDGFMDAAPLGFFDRLLTKSFFYVFIDWDIDPDQSTHNSTTYEISLCGQIGHRWGDSQPRTFD